MQIRKLSSRLYHAEFYLAQKYFFVLNRIFYFSGVLKTALFQYAVPFQFFYTTGKIVI